MPALAEVRARWLGAVTAALRDDPRVAGAALVGSLGAGTADDWSDVDLLVVVDDAHLDDYATAQRLPGRPAFAVDARHNGPRGTRAVSGQYLVAGLPLWADWHVHPASRAGWPRDGAVVFDRRGIGRLPLTFSEHLDAGEREPATRKGDDVRRAMRLALVPVAGKHVARRSPGTVPTIEFLGGACAPDASWEEHLAGLRRLLGELAGAGTPAGVAATRAYLDLVAEALRRPAS